MPGPSESRADSLACTTDLLAVLLGGFTSPTRVPLAVRVRVRVNWPAVIRGHVIDGPATTRTCTCTRAPRNERTHALSAAPARGQLISPIGKSIRLPEHRADVVVGAVVPVAH